MTEQSSQPPIEDAAPITLLMQLLSDRSKDALGPYVSGRGEFAPRWQAVAGLVNWGGAAVAPLCLALQDEDANTRRFAATALARIGDTRAVAPLVIAFQTSELYVQRYVAEALAAVGDERAVEALYSAVQKPDIAREALSALRVILMRMADTVASDLLHRIATLADSSYYIAEEPDTDGGYLSWNRVEHRLDCQPVKALAQQALTRRGYGSTSKGESE